ncbi:16S rRNA (cytidine(1402)-2'-O)-methyltransferase [Aestuariicella hydrocarbonica]|uniref:Ribosomal RNA small subunit methyltransferase I n=1 Tax=Pseudomaricurvus hydrocarbonicus TaxID=1470433 RepID=A0A9E5MLN8_9GAMM|nr:16S rRNA (cytidine(1402)-2'-O)-methyltransferase [Aestuariicella hydrocarbonica]NHO65063.1 16S rRNA (cytidine(1402)-2'-O)-methyltransferase [Aestuariicella hydrocarbonica]
MTEQALYVVATPIGNLGDMVPRAVEVLQTVDVIAAEDTRHSARLLDHFHISTPLVAYHDHTDEKQVEALIQRMKAGASIGLISDAGTPLVSDPGYRLVRRARQEGIRVVPVPGACAMVAALSASGLPSDRFSFEGFLPPKSGQRLNRLQPLAAEERTLIFYEAPHRIQDCLKDMATVFGAEREAVMAREITKTFETIKGGTLTQLVEFVAGDPNQRKGEMVVMVRGKPKAQDQGLDAEAERVMTILLQDLSVKQASQLGADITGLKKKVLYQWALERNAG